jgi:hypothetical protein
MPMINRHRRSAKMPLPQHSKLRRFNPALAILLLVSPLSLLAQTSLRITSPAEGTVFHPGESLKVNVEASGKFQQVIIVGWGPIGFSTPLSSPPYEFTIKIPDGISPGK